MDETPPEISISDAAVAAVAARGLFEEITLTLTGRSQITFLDKPYPLGLIDSTQFAVKEIYESFSHTHVDAIISIGSGEVAVDDIGHLLPLGYRPSSSLDFILSIFRGPRVANSDISRAPTVLTKPEARVYAMKLYAMKLTNLSQGPSQISS